MDCCPSMNRLNTPSAQRLVSHKLMDIKLVVRGDPLPAGGPALGFSDTAGCRPGRSQRFPRRGDWSPAANDRLGRIDTPTDHDKCHGYW